MVVIKFNFHFLIKGTVEGVQNTDWPSK